MTAWVLVIAVWSVLQGATNVEYVDPKGRFRFTYPASYGVPSPGTDDGFGDRVAAIRFANFSSGVIAPSGGVVLGGEAVLTRGFPLIDLQAVGGLYDAITLQIFPASLKTAILGLLPPLTAGNFCAELARERHLDPDVSSLKSLPLQQKSAVSAVDATRHVSPKILQCAVDGRTITFDEEVGFAPGGPRQRIYGVVRFLDGEYSTFQLVRGGAPPDPGVLASMTAVVQSFRVVN